MRSPDLSAQLGGGRGDCFAQWHLCSGHPGFKLVTSSFLTMLLHRVPLSHPQLADEEASILQAHAALLLDDLLDSLENISGHRDIPTHVDVSSLLLQALVHRLWQLLAQYILYVFLTERQRRRRRSDERVRRSHVWGKKQCENESVKCKRLLGSETK